MIRVRIEKVETVWRKTRNWNRMTDNPGPEQRQYDYVDAELPVEQTTLLLEQHLEDVDLVAVIKALNGIGE